MTRHDQRHKSIEGGSRWVEAGLRGHDDGVSRVDEGVETHRSRYENGDDGQRQNSMSSWVSQSFRNKKRGSPEIQKKTTVAFPGRVVYIPRQINRLSPIAPTSRLNDTTFRQLAKMRHRQDPTAMVTGDDDDDIRRSRSFAAFQALSLSFSHLE